MDTTETTYKVVFSGKLMQGFEEEQVEKAFAELFKLPLEKSQRILRKPRTLKKDLEQSAAERMRKKLERIGLEVRLEPQRSTNSSEMSLSLVPMEEVGNTAQSSLAAAASISLSCPNCEGKVTSMTEPCPHCGVYPHKILSRSQSPSSKPTQADAAEMDDADDSEEWHDGMTAKGFVLGAVAALIGAMVWKGIAIAMGYELGLIAWAIGGGIGFVVAFSGSRGQTAAVYCAVMALVAIIGGKYLFYADLQGNLGELLATSSEEFHVLYSEEIADAKALESVNGEDETREFMVQHGYSDASDSESVTSEELDQFQTETMPRLMSFADLPPSYEEWYQTTIEGNLSAVSASDLLKESFDFIDAIFLFLGITTAARVGYGGSRKT